MHVALYRSFAAMLLILSASRASAFDRAFMVAAPFSTDPVSVFALDGGKPWLFVDLPGLGSFFTVVESDWRLEPGPTRLIDVPPSHQENDLFWITPSDAQWESQKALGTWDILATYSLVGIQFAENGGIGVGVLEGAGSTHVRFDVVPSPVPIPPAFAIMLAPLAALVARKRVPAGTGAVLNAPAAAIGCSRRFSPAG